MMEGEPNRPVWNEFMLAWVQECDQPSIWGRCPTKLMAVTRLGLWFARWRHNRKEHRDKNQGTLGW